MGKIRRLRKTHHLPAVKVNSAQSQDGGLETMPMYSSVMPLGNPDASIFKNLKLDTKDSVLSNFDQKVPIPSAQPKLAQPVVNMSKKDKKKLRHTTFLSKIETIVNFDKETKATKKRQKTAVVGDVRPMADALPEINVLETSDKRTVKTKARPVKKFKARQAEMMKDILAFKQVRTHPSFQQDPEGTIMDHLHNKLKQELM